MASWVGIVPDQLRPALETLLRASTYAEECRADRWQVNREQIGRAHV